MDAPVRSGTRLSIAGERLELKRAYGSSLLVSPANNGMIAPARG